MGSLTCEYFGVAGIPQFPYSKVPYHKPPLYPKHLTLLPLPPCIHPPLPLQCTCPPCMHAPFNPLLHHSPILPPPYPSPGTLNSPLPQFLGHLSSLRTLSSLLSVTGLSSLLCPCMYTLYTLPPILSPLPPQSFILPTLSSCTLPSSSPYPLSHQEGGCMGAEEGGSVTGEG